MDIVQTRMTLEEFLALPETNRIVELINGEMIMSPPPSDVHQAVIGSLHFFIRGLIEGGILRFAPTGIRFDDENLPEPDIFWISPENAICKLGEDGRYWEGAPDLIIEILSPSTAVKDKREKFQLYQKYGVKEYWIVDPEARYIDVFQRKGDKLIGLGTFAEGDTFESTALSKIVDVRVALGG